MATTTNFGWETPDDTDLVKDGALAMRTLGNAIDASFVDLKGGTTGQVLAKASNTDLDYSWVTQDDANAIQNAIVDAKGDLIAATANDTPARLAVGNNGETLVADSSASTGLRWQADSNVGRNKILNSDFRIWQRGTSISLTNNTTAYTADRWYIYTSFSAGSSSLSQQTFTPGSAPVAGYEGFYFARFTAGSTATYFELGQRIEDVRAFAGQTATLSFWAKASTNTTLSSTLLQNFGSGGSSQVSVSGASHSVTTSWTRFTATVSVPSISGKTVGTSSYLAFTLAANSLTGSQTIDIWGVQLEAGSVATPFTTATGTLAGELAACQRYYWRAGGDSVFQYFGMGSFYSSTGAYIQLLPPVTLRTAPSALEYSTLQTYDFSSTQTISNITLAAGSRSVTLLDVTLSSGGTQFRPNLLRANNSTSAYIALSAEL